MKDVALTVTQLNEYVRLTLTSDPVLHGIDLVGEISNFKQYGSGHWYFTLKDEEAAISCVMFRTYAAMLRFQPENGQKVRLHGSVSLYAKTGSYQFNAEGMTAVGAGDLYRRFEELKKKLMAEGLFEESRKKPLPAFPKGIGIVTSRTGAVVHDIAHVTWRRFPSMPLYLYSVKVQGEGAAEEIAEGLRRMDALDAVDVIITGRGGGSMEDLWAFNEEVVARAIAACRKPVISAVGHETDFSIADFTADVRAATPSHAAEMAVPLVSAMREDVNQLRADLQNSLTFALKQKRNAVLLLAQRMKAQTPQHRYRQTAQTLGEYTRRMNTAFSHALQQKRDRVSGLVHGIETVSPQHTLNRGYAIVLADGRPVHSAASLEAGMPVTLRFASGGARADITETWEENA